MSGSVNRVILVGNLGKDPEVRTIQTGAKIVSFPLATSDTWNDKQSGERRERTEWAKVVIFNEHLADVAERFLRKGRKVYLEGSLQTRKWTDQSGQERYTTEVVLAAFRGELVLLDSRQDESVQSRPAEQGQRGNSGNNQRQQTGSARTGYDRSLDRRSGWNDDLGDEVPF